MNPRLRRLQADYEDVRVVYSGHPHVLIEPGGHRLPPETYRVDYTLSGLRLVGDRPGNLEVEKVEVEKVETHSVEIMLPRLYPTEKPYVVPKSPIFHPNIKDYYCLVDDENWAPSTRLVDLVAKIGNMIQYRLYNLGSPLDALAAHWVRELEPTGFFPVGEVDLGVADLDLNAGAAASKPPEISPEAEKRLLIDFSDETDSDRT